jgi:uncharacterized protein YbjT (DUF2867 family)
MDVLVFGATGMVGAGVLRECLAAPDVGRVRTVGRAATGLAHPRLDEVVHADLLHPGPVEDRLGGFDACFFCLGVSSLGRDEADYTRSTYDLTLALAGPLARLNPGMTFVYVSGAGTDAGERGRSLWARVKGRTENALLRLPFRAVYLFRPGLIVPVHGVRSKTAWTRWFYALAAPLLPLLRRLWPDQVLTTEVVGRAMLEVARRGAPAPVLESSGINRMGA